MPRAEIATAYVPRDVEEKQYALWLEQGVFDAEVRPEREPFCILIPPPNVTSKLHLGHALDLTVQDVLTRWQRMRGRESLWMPGMDHAGIATQNVVERELAEEGLSRHQLGRGEFVKRVWQAADRHRDSIVDQLKRLGASCDWRRERFTLDEQCSRAVREAFVTMYDARLIYRGVRMVDWCPRCHTGISDIEVEHVQAAGHLWYIHYPGADGGEGVMVATTRPETMLGDTAVAVHPDDERYKALVGHKVRLPLMDRTIPVITDPQVDPEFGTGAVKITPAHDPNDFEIGVRHNLEQVVVIGLDGLMTEVAGRFACMSREDCREKVLEALQEERLLVKTEAHVHAVGTCSRCHTAIEPLVSEQWFVKTSELAKAGIEAVRSGRIRFVPERWAKVYLDWMEGIRDWCISRQLWWGHRIPVFYCEGCDHEFAAREDPDKCPECGGTDLKQDPDVLDTWFSSGLWPISTMGWPESTSELEYFHPTSVLVTAYDIITFWVARMIMMDLYLTGQEPFGTVFIHGLVRDVRGRKMSKSEGNVIDPRAAMDQYGTDAVRFALMSLISHGQDIAVSPDRFVGARNFCNKLWNASRLVITNLDAEAPQTVLDDAALELADRWILARRDAAVAEVTQYLENYELADAARRIYQFVWDEFCDWYLEMAKQALYGDDDARGSAVRAVLAATLRDILKLLHPFTPFITEQLWQTLHDGTESLAVQPWPEAGKRPDAEAVEEAMNTLQAVIRAARHLRSTVGLPPSQRVEAILTAPDDECAELLRREESQIRNLAGLSDLELTVGGVPDVSRALPTVAAGVHVLVKVPDDVDVAREMDKLNAQLARLSRELESSQRKLANEKFVNRAPAEVVEKERARRQDLGERKAKLEERIGLLEDL